MPVHDAQRPQGGSCDALVGWHIERGHYGDVSLDGLNVAVGVHTPGNMKEKDWTAALYVDDRADERQREALTRIFGGQAGGYPARIAEHVATVAGVEVVPIRCESDAKRGRMQVGRGGEAEWEPIAGQGGGPVTITALCWLQLGRLAAEARAAATAGHDAMGGREDGGRTYVRHRSRCRTPPIRRRPTCRRRTRRSSASTSTSGKATRSAARHTTARRRSPRAP